MRNEQLVFRWLNYLFERYNKKFWGGHLENCVVDIAGTPQCGYGYFDSAAKRIIVEVNNHTSRQQIKETLVHEMAHASTNQDHEDQWRIEMERVKAAGAPTDELDFLIPYSSRAIVTSFMDYADRGATWLEARNDLRDWVRMDFDSDAERVLQQARKFFELAQEKARLRSSSRGHLSRPLLTAAPNGPCS